MNNDKSIILLSGGLDSAVSLHLCKDTDNIKLALFFNYGQKAFEQERKSVSSLCKHYDIYMEIIDLMWLKKITNTSLVNNNQKIPDIDTADLDNQIIATKTKENVWIPNRNALFLNIAACFADSFGYSKIIIGANAEEAKTFSDNSREFINNMNNTLKFSTQIHPEVIAPLINLDKRSIIKHAKQQQFPFELIWSCYSNESKHCGKCESCKRLKRGLESNGLFDIVNVMFGT